MRFLSIYKAAETGVPPTPEEMEAMGQLIEEMTRRGKLLATEGCLPSALGARVRRAGDQVTVTDGPFTESKELVAGFALLEADSKEEAIELTRRFLAVAGDGECEVRQLFVGPECIPDAPAYAEAAAAQA
ncbi:MAG TPA: YciI family protein [Longimicrobium sp.]